jgi:hypothetical protein
MARSSPLPQHEPCRRAPTRPHRGGPEAGPGRRRYGVELKRAVVEYALPVRASAPRSARSPRNSTSRPGPRQSSSGTPGNRSPSVSMGMRFALVPALRGRLAQCGVAGQGARAEPVMADNPGPLQRVPPVMFLDTTTPAKAPLVRVHEELVAQGARRAGRATVLSRIDRILPAPRDRSCAARAGWQYHFDPGQEMQHDTSPHKSRLGDRIRTRPDRQPGLMPLAGPAGSVSAAGERQRPQRRGGARRGHGCAAPGSTPTSSTHRSRRIGGSEATPAAGLIGILTTYNRRSRNRSHRCPPDRR